MRDIQSMMGIPSGKLQRNIKENTVFLNLYSQQIQEAIADVDIRELLKMSLWEYRRLRDNGSSEERQICLCCLIYFHSLWVCSKCNPNPQNKDYSQVFKTIFRLMKENIKRTSLYIDYSLLLEKAEGKINLEELEKKRRDLYRKVLPREPKITAFFELQKYDDLIWKSLGAKSLELEKGFCAIIDSGFKGIDHLTEEFSSFNEKIKIEAEKFKKVHSRMTESEMVSRIVMEQGWQQWNDSLTGRRDGFDLYDVQKLTDFSDNLCDKLSIEPRQIINKEFWLLNSTEYLNHPFVKCNNRYYCFTSILIGDHIVNMVKNAVIDGEDLQEKDWITSSKKTNETENIKGQLGPDLFDNLQKYSIPIKKEIEKPETIFNENIIEEDDNTLDAIDKRINELLSLSKTNNNIINSLLKLDDKDKKELFSMIDKATDAWKEDNSEKIFSINQLQLSFIIGRNTTDPMKKLGRNQNIAARMYATGREEWHIINIIHEMPDIINSVHVESITKKDFSDWEWKAVLKIARERFFS